jgi:hypothetical protein
MYFHGPVMFGEPPTPAPVQFNDPFPNIKQKMPELYREAWAAHNDLATLREFKPVFSLLQAATGNSYLSLDRLDRIVVEPDHQATSNLLGPKLAEAVLKSTGKATLKHVLGEEFGNILGVLDLLHKLTVALSGPDNKDLVNNQRGTRFMDAKKHKLRFFIALLIARVAPNADRGKVTAWMWDNYWRYEKALENFWKYENIEKNLSMGARPYQRQAPVMKEYKGPMPRRY